MPGKLGRSAPKKLQGEITLIKQNAFAEVKLLFDGEWQSRSFAAFNTFASEVSPAEEDHAKVVSLMEISESLLKEAETEITSSIAAVGRDGASVKRELDSATVSLLAAFEARVEAAMKNLDAASAGSRAKRARKQ